MPRSLNLSNSNDLLINAKFIVFHVMKLNSLLLQLDFYIFTIIDGINSGS